MATTKKVSTKVSKSKPLNISEMSKADLLKKSLELKDELIVLKKGTIMGDVQNVRAYKFKRRELARVLTALNNKGNEESK